MEEKNTAELMIDNAPLNEEDKNLWRKALKVMPEEDQENMVSLLKDKKENWLFFTENLKSKMAAIEKKDEQWFSWIVEKEKEFLNQTATD